VQLINTGGARRGGELDELVIVRAVILDTGETAHSYNYFVNENFNNFGAAQIFFPPFDCVPGGELI
jgi:hypothetical protein